MGPGRPRKAISKALRRSNGSRRLTVEEERRAAVRPSSALINPLGQGRSMQEASRKQGGRGRRIRRARRGQAGRAKRRGDARRTLRYVHGGAASEGFKSLPSRRTPQDDGGLFGD